MGSLSCRRLASTVHKRSLNTTATAAAAAARTLPCGPPASPRVRSAELGIVRSPEFHRQIRGKKTRTTVNLSDLPQGVIKAPEAPLPSVREEQDEAPSYPTVVLQARRNMAKFENCVLLTRVGGFYELYFEHAEEYGPLLNLKVASKKTNAGPVAMVSPATFVPPSNAP